MSLRPHVRMRPRWRKMFSDLFSNKVRTLLVVASVAVGLFAVGMIATLHSILRSDIRDSYAAVNPANIQVSTAPFSDDTVDQARNVDGVQYAEAARAFEIMARTGPDEWSRVAIQAIPDFDEMNINKLNVEQGTWPPGKHEIVIERNKVDELYLTDGMLELKLPSGKIRRLKLTGVVHSLTVGAASTGGGFFLAPMQGYISTDTLESLEQPDNYNQLNVTVTQNRDDRDHLREIANRVSKAIEDNNGLVYNAMIRGSHDHPNLAYVDAMSGILFVLGALIVFLSGFLITNTLTSLLNQQSQQIAIMKTVGARSKQVISIYTALIFTFGVLALIIALPTSREAAFAWLRFLTGTLNFDVLSYRTVPLAVILQVVIAMLVPQVAGIMPVLRGSRVKVQDALSGSLTEEDTAHRGWLDRRIYGVGRKGPSRARLLTRPLLISLRNTFRHKGRLALTLITLSLGGAIFIGTFNARASLDSYIRKLGNYFMADVNLTLGDSYRIEQVREALKDVPGVGEVEGWAYGRSELLLADDKAGDAVQILAPPGDSALIKPIMLKGRWVTKDDRQAIVLSERFLSQYPDLKVGDTLRLRVNGEKMEWKVVGFFQLAGKSAGFVAYSNYEYLSEAVHAPNRAVAFRIVGDVPGMSLAQQEDLGTRIEAALQERGYEVTDVSAGQSLIENTSRPLNVLTLFLLLMAVLTALVGSIGLMGTMSMNVLDRTREIGVMRAIGASDRAVMNMVLVEGVLIGLISWVLAAIAAVPISKVLSDTIHLAVFDAKSEFTFTAFGPLAWLGVVILLSVLASVLPARSAAHLTIREALAYE